MSISKRELFLKEKLVDSESISKGVGVIITILVSNKKSDYTMRAYAKKVWFFDSAWKMSTFLEHCQKRRVI